MNVYMIAVRCPATKVKDTDLIVADSFAMAEEVAHEHMSGVEVLAIELLGSAWIQVTKED